MPRYASGKQSLLLLAMLLLSSEAMSMGTMYLFSEVRGVVVHKGKPLVGTVVEQTYQRGDKTVRTEVKTNDKGEFYFPAVTKWSLLSVILPHEPQISQMIVVKHENADYKAWRYTKGNYDQNGELDGKAINLYCALEAPIKRTEVRGDWDYISGMCELR